MATPGTTEREAGSGPGIGRILLAGIALCSLLVAAVSLVRTTRSFYSLDFRVSWLESAVRIETAPLGSSAADAGLTQGELIVTVDERPVAGLEDPVGVMSRGRSHRLAVVAADGSRRQVDLRPPPPRVDLVYLARCAVAIFGLVCALFATLASPRKEVPTFLLLAVASLLVATIPHRTASSALMLNVLHRSAGAAVSFLLVRFFAIFPERRPMTPLWDVLTVAGMAVSASTAVVPGGEVYWPTVATGLRALFLLSLLSAGIFGVRRWLATARAARERRQIEVAALGMLVGLLPYAALVLLPEWLGFAFEPFHWLAVLPVAAIPAGFLAGLMEYRLWDIEPLTRDTLSAALVVVISGLSLAAVNQVLLSRGAGSGPVRNLAVFLTGVMVVVLMQPVRRRVERFLDRWLYHGQPAPRWLLTNSTRELARITDPRELLQRLTEVLHAGLEVEQVATYLRDDDASYRRVTGDVAGLPEALPGEAGLQPFPHPAERPIHVAGFASRTALERAGTVHGLLYLGLRRGIFPLGREGRDVVASFAAQAALGLESARLVDDLRRRAEEYRILHANTRRIIESSAAGIIVCDARGRVLSCNAHAAGILSSSGRELIGMPLGKRVNLPKGWKEELPMYAANAEASTKADDPLRLVMAVSVLELERGRFDGRVVVLQDVTELEELRGRLREQERLASLGRLAAGLAHEINTPLTGIASFAQMLEEVTPDEDARAELVHKLVDQSFRVSRIVANLHALVKGDRAESAAVNLLEVTQRAARDAARSLGSSDLLDIESPEDGVVVAAVSGLLELAVSNLVRNGFEASGPGSRVVVTVAGAGDWGEIWVDDCGPGVPEDLRERVFEPFFTTRKDRGGTGLGLAITRDMILQLGGEVRLEQSPRGGARAIVRVPRWVGLDESSSSTTSPSSRTS